MDAQGMVHNDSSRYTRHNSNFSSRSSPDVTISHENIGHLITDWNTHKKLSSDHLPITFSVELKASINATASKNRFTLN